MTETRTNIKCNTKKESNGFGFWRTVVFLAVFILIDGAAVALLRNTLTFSARRTAGSMILLGSMLVYVMRIDRTTPVQMGFSSRKLVRSIVLGSSAGIAWGFVILGTAPGGQVILGKGLGILKLRLIPMYYLGSILSVNGIACVMIAISEEVAFRGLILKKAEAYWGSQLIAAIFTSALFVAFHIDYVFEGQLLQAFLIFIMQLLLCVGYLKMGNIFFAVGWHYAYNAFMIAIPNIAERVT